MFDYYNSSITSKPLLDDNQLGGIRGLFGQRKTAVPTGQMPGSASGMSSKVQSALGGGLNSMFGSANQRAGTDFERAYGMANTQNLLGTETARANSGLRGYGMLSDQNAQQQQQALQQRGLQAAMMRMLTPYVNGA